MDGTGHQLCRFHGFFAIAGGGFVVRTPAGELLGRVCSESFEGHYTFRTRQGASIGTIRERFETEDGYLVAVTDVPGCGRVARVLMLAAALALDIVYRDRAGSEPAAQGSAWPGAEEM
jgi:hypothetical protein